MLSPAFQTMSLEALLQEQSRIEHSLQALQPPGADAFANLDKIFPLLAEQGLVAQQIKIAENKKRELDDLQKERAARALLPAKNSAGPPPTDSLSPHSSHSPNAALAQTDVRTDFFYSRLNKTAAADPEGGVQHNLKKNPPQEQAPSMNPAEIPMEEMSAEQLKEKIKALGLAYEIATAKRDAAYIKIQAANQFLPVPHALEAEYTAAATARYAILSQLEEAYRIESQLCVAQHQVTATEPSRPETSNLPSSVGAESGTQVATLPTAGPSQNMETQTQQANSTTHQHSSNPDSNRKERAGIAAEARALNYPVEDRHVLTIWERIVGLFKAIYGFLQDTWHKLLSSPDHGHAHDGQAIRDSLDRTATRVAGAVETLNTNAYAATHADYAEARKAYIDTKNIYESIHEKTIQLASGETVSNAPFEEHRNAEKAHCEAKDKFIAQFEIYERSMPTIQKEDFQVLLTTEESELYTEIQERRESQARAKSTSSSPTRLSSRK